MKNILWAVLVTVCITSCIKKEDEACTYNDILVAAPAGEIANIQAYLNANSIVAVQHSSGLFYKIDQVGTGKAVENLCSVVTVKYSGRFTNGTYFDPTTPGATTIASFTLGNVIVAWQKGVPLISSGGKITLYVPPTLGYGNQDVKNSANVVVIPANSILIFEIELLAVN